MKSDYCNGIFSYVMRFIYIYICVYIYIYIMYILYIYKLFRNPHFRKLYRKENVWYHPDTFEVFCLKSTEYEKQDFSLTLSWRRSLSYRNRSIDLQIKSMDWFLYDRNLCRERAKALAHCFNLRLWDITYVQIIT